MFEVRETLERYYQIWRNLEYKSINEKNDKFQLSSKSIFYNSEIKCLPYITSRTMSEKLIL